MPEPKEKRNADNRKSVARSGDIPVAEGATTKSDTPREGDALLAKMLNTPKAKG